MPSNTRKPQLNLSKPSEGSGFGAGSKPTESTNPLGGLNITAERELGTVGDIKATGKLNVGVDNLLGQQGIDIELDATNRTAGFGAGIGSTSGKLGVNIGGKIGYDENGNVSIKGAEVGVNIAGFGGSASIDEDEGVKGSISAAGAKIEIGIDKEGKKSVSVCYGVPGGEICVTFEPGSGLKTPSSLSPSPTAPTNWEKPLVPVRNPQVYFKVVIAIQSSSKEVNNDGTLRYELELQSSGSYSPRTNTTPETLNAVQQVIKNYPSNKFTTSTYLNSAGIWGFNGLVGVFNRIVNTSNPYGGVYQPYDILVRFEGLEPNVYTMLGYIYINEELKQAFYTSYRKRTYTVIYSTCSLPASNSPSPSPTPSPYPSSTDKIQLPNHPQHFKRMNCCDKVEEIYKYLGIAKLKRNKFPVSNAFLVPGGKGNDNCFDYYSIMQALFRMLANGLIINPKSKPLGSEWQNANATAWASAMYEMMAETMSDGNSTQRFEVAAIMQLTQMMATLAENGRKIEFVADEIGIEPLPVSEEVHVCFTIYEGHKGFGKKEPKKINVSGLKTDDDVEKVLGKMLNPSFIPNKGWKYKPRQISINEALRNG